MGLFWELATSQSIVIKSLAELVADDETDGLGKVLKLGKEIDEIIQRFKDGWFY